MTGTYCCLAELKDLWAPSIFSSSRKPLNFQNLPEHVDQLLQVDSEDGESQGMQGSRERTGERGVRPWRSLHSSCQTLGHPSLHTSPFPGQVEGRLGPSTVVLDHTGGFEGLLLVDDDLLGVSAAVVGP